MLIIQHERSMLNLDNKKPLLYWFCLLFDHSQVDIDYHQFILARWVLLLTVLPWCYFPEDRSHWWLASAGPQIQCCTWCVQSSQLHPRKSPKFWRQKVYQSHDGQFGKVFKFVVFLWHPSSTCLDNSSGPKMTKHCLAIMVWVQIVTKAVVLICLTATLMRAKATYFGA